MSKYRALRFVVGLYRVLAWITLVLGVLAAIGVMVGGAQMGRFAPGGMRGSWPFMMGNMGVAGAIISGLLVLLYTLFLFVIMLAGAEFIVMLMDIEHNTRETAYYLKGELEAVPPRAEPVTWEPSGPNV